VSPVEEFEQAFVRAIQERERRSARDAAEAAWYPGHPLTVDALEAKIRNRRAADAALIANLDTTKAA
jgi:hypothetical protein